MPLSPVLSVKSYTADATSGTNQDDTVYGGANPARSAVVTYTKFYKLDRLGNATELTVASYDPETATEYTYTLPQDGWVQQWFVIIQDYAGGTTYNRYDVVYNDSDNKVYRSVSVAPFSGQAPPNLTYWEEITDPVALIENDGEANESANLIWTIFDFIATPNTRIYAGDAVDAASSDCCSDCERSEKVLDYEFFYVQLDGMVGAGQRSRFAAGEKMARKAQEEYNRTC